MIKRKRKSKYEWKRPVNHAKPKIPRMVLFQKSTPVELFSKLYTKKLNIQEQLYGDKNLAKKILKRQRRTLQESTNWLFTTSVKREVQDREEAFQKANKKVRTPRIPIKT